MKKDGVASMMVAIVIVLGAIVLVGGAWYYHTAHKETMPTSVPAVAGSVDQTTTTPPAITSTVATTSVPMPKQVSIASQNNSGSITTKGISITTSIITNTSNSLTQADLLAMAGDPYADGILPLGDYKYSTTGPKRGYVYLCNVAQGGGGAQVSGPWIGTSTWNSDQKINVQGSVSWPEASVQIAVNGSTRTIATNDLPTVGTTGIFPIAQSDPAYQYDMNPNSITAQNITVSLPANPNVAATPSCIYGEVGVMTDGVLLLDAFDEEYRDAAAHEILDSCDGHPHEGGMYHYHSLSACIPDINETTVIGWAFDGFPITGPEVAPGKYLTTADLDECHGITSAVNMNGTMVNTYHYVMTQDFPYSVSCFRGKSYEPKPAANGQMNMGNGGSNNNSMNGMPMNGANGNQTPPQAAISACTGKSSASVCSFTTPNGTVNGSCNETPGGEVACVPG